MQEGTLAFLQMVKITGAVTAHRRARLPYLVYLRHPSTGGVFASWASVGHLTLAQPGALIGFLGPRVYEALAGRAFPEGIQTAENLAAHGLIDAVIAPDRLGGLVARVLDALTPASEAQVASGAGVAGRAGWGWGGRDGGRGRVGFGAAHPAAGLPGRSRADRGGRHRRGDRARGQRDPGPGPDRRYAGGAGGPGSARSAARAGRAPGGPARGPAGRGPGAAAGHGDRHDRR